jgi:hypothetical protein
MTDPATLTTTMRTDVRAVADDLASAIASDGIAAHEAAAKELARRAMHRGLVPVVSQILADPAAPPVARQRAFGRVAQALALDGSAVDSDHGTDGNVRAHVA